MGLLLKGQGALYVEMPTASAALANAIERASGLALRWRRDLARGLAPRRPLAETEAMSVARCGRVASSALLRLVDRFAGTRLSAGRAGFYFGHEWRSADLRARLNGCIRCDAIHSSDQILAAAPLISRYPLPLYRCPACGAFNILTEDR